MTSAGDNREVIPSGKQPPFSFQHLVPLARFLVEERGHGLFPKEDGIVSYEWGFADLNGLRCQLTRRITDHDWTAINDRFVLPDTIGYHDGRIRDNLHRIVIEGVEQMITEDGPIPIEEWEARERAEGRMK